MNSNKQIAAVQTISHLPTDRGTITKIIYRPGGGSNLNDILHEASILALLHDVPVEFTFTDKTRLVRPEALLHAADYDPDLTPPRRPKVGKSQMCS